MAQMTTYGLSRIIMSLAPDRDRDRDRSRIALISSMLHAEKKREEAVGKRSVYRFQQKYQSKCEIETIGQMIGSLSDQLSVIPFRVA